MKCFIDTMMQPLISIMFYWYFDATFYLYYVLLILWCNLLSLSCFAVYKFSFLFSFKRKISFITATKKQQVFFINKIMHFYHFLVAFWLVLFPKSLIWLLFFQTNFWFILSNNWTFLIIILVSLTLVSSFVY